MITPKKTKGIEQHELVPKHEKLTDTEKEKLFSEINTRFKDLPKIYRDDPAIADNAEIKTGDVIKITRKSVTAKETMFYRGVVDA